MLEMISIMLAECRCPVCRERLPAILADISGLLCQQTIDLLAERLLTERTDRLCRGESAGSHHQPGDSAV